MMRMRATAYFFAGLEQAGLLVTAIRFGSKDVTTLARPCQSIKRFSHLDRSIRSCSTGTKCDPLKQIGSFPCKKAKAIYLRFTRRPALHGHRGP